MDTEFFFAMQHNILLSNTFKDTFSSLTCTMQCCIRVHVSGYYINSWISSRYAYRVIFARVSTKQEKLFWNFRLSANWTRDMKKGKIYITVKISSVCLCFHLNFLLSWSCSFKNQKGSNFKNKLLWTISYITLDVYIYIVS